MALPARGGDGTAAARSRLTWAPCGSGSITSSPGGPTGSRSTPGPSSGWRGTAGATRRRRRSGRRRARWRSARASWPSPPPGSGCSASPRVGPARVTLARGPSFSGHAVARHLAGARRAVAFVLTLGPALEAEVIALGERQELLEAYLLDLAGWAGIEAAVRALRRDLITAFPRARVSHRLGPGHRDWPLTEQRDLVTLFEGDDAPVRLSEHGVLIPFKSISGLFALRDGVRP